MYYVALTRAMKSECILLYGTVKKPKIQADYDYVVKTLQKRNPSAANGRRANIRITPKV
jgi:DNA helicase-2/ATP-dependent DNA helicase PcrA